MTLINCAKCGGLFVQIQQGSNNCLDCQKELDGEYQKLKQYLLEHPQATLQDIFQHTDIPLQRVMNWIREGRVSKL